MTPSCTFSLHGFGAIAEQYISPSLKALQLAPLFILDPNQARIAIALQLWPGILPVSSIHSQESPSEAAIISSPSRFHAEQAIQAMAAGMHVLCEKPMANTVAEAEEMIATSERTGKLLAVGLFRRFFPSTRAIKEIVEKQTLGRMVRYDFAEGGLFNWPAASATFFSKEASGGGVLHDLGVHTLDLALHWFGEPSDLEYEDDAAGGLETNCLVRLNHDGFHGQVRLSRDWTTSNRYFIEFERGWVAWRVGAANEIEMGLPGSDQAYKVQICGATEHWGNPAPSDPGYTYHQAFTAQLANFVAAIEGRETLMVPGSEGIRSLRLIERCYQQKEAML